MPRKFIILSFIIIFAFLLPVFVSLTTDMSLGDEVYHYRFARDIFNAGRRVAFDPLYGGGISPGYFYNCPPLWHILLASSWRLCGNISFPVAQFYHSIYYALLILFTYLLAKEIYGREHGLYSALIVATVPVVTAFGILFYLDIPATCISVLCLLLIVKRRFFLSGVILGLMYLTKQNTYFFIPAFIFLIFYKTESNYPRKVKNLFYFIVPAFLFVFPDFLWREENLRSTLLADDGKTVTSSRSYYETVAHRLELPNWNLKSGEYLNSYLSNSVDIGKYFGIILLIALVIYVLFRLYEKKDLIVWFPILCYFLFFCYIFHPASDIRYLLPIVPLLAILSSKAIAKYVSKGWLRILLIFLCLLQFSSTVLYVRARRQVPEGIKQAFNYIKHNTPPDALIIYPEYVILEWTDRRFCWSGNLPDVFRNFFWNKNENKLWDLLKSRGVDYIAVKKSRVYDDSKNHHLGGYPKSFVERLPELFFVKLVFDNEEASIWEVEK